jgi:hypothetical protein
MFASLTAGLIKKGRYEEIRDRKLLEIGKRNRTWLK